MADRIDHAAEALKALALIRGVDEATNQITLALDAQAHATLALVEQQRIANRLVIASLDLLVEISERSGHTLDFRVLPYLTKGDWASLSVVEEARDGD